MNVISRNMKNERMNFLKGRVFVFLESVIVSILFLFLCLKTSYINKHGYYQFSILGSDVIYIDLSTETNLILQYPHQNQSFIQAAIIFPQNTTTYLLDPTQDAVISGSVIQLRMFQSYPMLLSIWALPKTLCPLISFTIPDLDSFTLSITATKLSESFCVVTKSYETNHDYYYGIYSNYSFSSYEVFSQNELELYDVCQDIYCKIVLNGSVLFWFNNLNNLTLQTFIQSRYSVNESRTIDASFELSPLPFYNFTEKYIVGHNFDKVIIKPVNNNIQFRKQMAHIMFFISTGLSFFFLILKTIDVLLTFYKSKRNVGPISYDSTNAQPITLVLNQYCPNTSAKIVVPNL